MKKINLFFLLYYTLITPSLGTIQQEDHKKLSQNHEKNYLKKEKKIRDITLKNMSLFRKKDYVKKLLSLKTLDLRTLHFIEDHSSKIKKETIYDKKQFSKIDPNNFYETKKYQCSNENINRLYESLLAKEMIQNKSFNKKIHQIYSKIFRSMNSIPIQSHHGLGSWFLQALEAWSQNEKFEYVLPVTQKQKIQDLKEAILASQSSFVLPIDLILFNAKGLDQIGIEDAIKSHRDHSFKELKINRGTRVQKEEDIPLRTDLGILRYDLETLKLKNAHPWKHWGRDMCFIDPESSKANQFLVQSEIPIVCGLSGTTRLALWSILGTSVELDPEELRLVLLSIWASLAADGGHSLQEVLIASYLSALYLNQVFHTDPFIKNRFHQKTLENLYLVTRNIAYFEGLTLEKNEIIKTLQEKAEIDYLDDLLSYSHLNSNQFFEIVPIHEKNAHFGAYYSEFFSKVKTSSFHQARMKAFKKLIDSIHQHLSSCEKL